MGVVKQLSVISCLLVSSCCVASKIFNDGISTDYLNNVRGVNGIVNEIIFNSAGCCCVKPFLSLCFTFVFRSSARTAAVAPNHGSENRLL